VDNTDHGSLSVGIAKLLYRQFRQRFNVRTLCEPVKDLVSRRIFVGLINEGVKILG
jgi:hypothetical protein